MFGYRKVAVVVFLGTLAASVDLSAHQADVLIALAWAYLGSNAAIGLGKSLREKVLPRSSISRVRSVTDPEQVAGLAQYEAGD